MFANVVTIISPQGLIDDVQKDIIQAAKNYKIKPSCKSLSVYHRDRSEIPMNQEQADPQELPRADDHPWLTQMPASADEDSVGEVIRYTLDEIRFA